MLEGGAGPEPRPTRYSTSTLRVMQTNEKLLSVIASPDNLVAAKAGVLSQRRSGKRERKKEAKGTERGNQGSPSTRPTRLSLRVTALRYSKVYSTVIGEELSKRQGSDFVGFASQARIAGILSFSFLRDS